MPFTKIHSLKYLPFCRSIKTFTDVFRARMLRALVALLALALVVPLADVLCFVWLRADLPDECAGAVEFWACLYWYLCGSEE